MSGVRTYDPKNVQVLLGSIPMSGFHEDIFVSLAADEDFYTKSMGVQGEVSRAASNNHAATLTLTLSQTSPSNEVLTGFMLADQVSNSGIFPVLIKELGSGSTLISTQAAWITRPPQTDYGKEIGAREWIISMSKADWFIGGNSLSGQAA